MYKPEISDFKQTKKEKAIQTASITTGAIAGGTAAVGGVVVGGAAGTYGAAALTSGLAALGSILGGGMLAGVSIVAAAPIAGGFLGYSVFKLFKRLSRRY